MSEHRQWWSGGHIRRQTVPDVGTGDRKGPGSGAKNNVTTSLLHLKNWHIYDYGKRLCKQEWHLPKRMVTQDQKKFFHANFSTGIKKFYARDLRCTGWVTPRPTQTPIIVCLNVFYQSCICQILRIYFSLSSLEYSCSTPTSNSWTFSISILRLRHYKGEICRSRRQGGPANVTKLFVFQLILKMYFCILYLGLGCQSNWKI